MQEEQRNDRRRYAVARQLYEAASELGKDAPRTLYLAKFYQQRAAHDSSLTRRMLGIE